MTFDAPLSLAGHHAQVIDDMQDFSGVSPDGGIAMWVADMQFRAADCILDAVRAEVDRGYMGYFGDKAPVSAAVAGWLDRRHGWRIDPSVVRFTHGVVAGFATAIDAVSAPGDAVILFSPVYHAFYRKLAVMGRSVLESPLVLKDGRYEMDLDALGASLKGNEKALVLCSPHNPGGRLWSEDELRAVAAFCERHDLILISDEIHMDLTFPGARHIPTSVAAPEARPRLIVLTAASKAFNIAGGETGYVVIEDAGLLRTFDAAQAARGGTPNRFGMIMTKAAYTGGDAWLDSARAYIADNFALWKARIGALPGVEVMDMQSTYLSWVNLAGTGCSEAEIRQRLNSEARIAMSYGAPFGSGSDGYYRFNLALPRPLLTEAIGRIEAAFADLQ